LKKKDENPGPPEVPRLLAAPLRRAFPTLEHLRLLPPADQDRLLKLACDEDPTLQPQLATARKHYHGLQKKLVVRRFRELFPDLTSADVDTLMTCYDRVFGVP
jgi:hypothetical protein